VHRRGLVLGACCLLLVVACQFVVYPAAREQDRSRDPRSLSIATFNAWLIPVVAKRFASRLARMPRAIAAVDPDIICIQEVWTNASRDALVRGLRAVLPHHAPGRGGLLICSRYPIRSSRFTQFPVHPGLTFEELLAAKGMLEAVIDTPSGKVRVLTTHLALDRGEDPELTKAYEAQIAILLARLETLRDLPLFVAADLNLFSVRDGILDPLYERVVTAPGFVDSDPPRRIETGDGQATTWTPRRFTRVRWPVERTPAMGWSPDYVLGRSGAGRDYELLSHSLYLDTPESALSDHRLVFTTWQLR
jgi:endonuclease/exonuclease/phosphatase family metal-dependent hydrolase